LLVEMNGFFDSLSMVVGFFIGVAFTIISLAVIGLRHSKNVCRIFHKRYRTVSANPGKIYCSHCEKYR